MFKGFLHTDNHNIEFIEGLEMGGGAEEYTAWCHTCDPKGASTIVSEVKKSTTLAQAVLILKLATHVHSATRMKDARQK